MAANGTKEYKIVINGLQENINAVESLNKQLDDVEKRLNAINQKGVNVSTPKGGGSYKGELDAQEKLEKQILATEEKLAQVRDENYKKLLHMKEELKEYTQIAKSQVAAEANQQGLFDTNTMAGMKASLKSIKAEMQMVDIGGDRFQELTRQANELNNKLKEIEQSYKAMDAALDTMQSLVSIAQVGQGLGALFGFDDSEIQRSIQKLVALQNVMMGVEKINQQIESRQGIGKWLAGVNTAVDKAVASMLKFNTALLGTSKAAKVAATGIKAFGTALKVAISGGILLAIDAAINAFTHLIDRLKNGTKEMQAVRQATEAGTEAYVKAKIEMDNLISRINAFNGTKEQEKKLVDELNSKYSDSIGQYKSLAEWKDALIKKAPAYLEMMKKEAEMQAWINKLVEAQVKLKEIEYAQTTTFFGKLGKFMSDLTGWHPTTDKLRDEIALADEEYKKLRDEVNKLMSDNRIGDFAPQIEKNNNKIKKATVDGLKELNELRIATMKEGLLKALRQLEEERRQKIAKIRKDGVMVGELELATNKLYDQRIEDEKKKHAKEVENIYREMFANILRMQQENAQKVLENEEMEARQRQANLNGKRNTFYKNRTSSYGIQGAEYLSPSTRDTLGLQFVGGDSEMIKDIKVLVDLERELVDLEFQENILGARLEKINDERIKKELESLRELHMEKYMEIVDYQNGLMDFYDEQGEEVLKIQKDLEEKYAADISTIYKQRLTSFELYWEERNSITKENLDKIMEAEKAVEEARYQSEKQAQIAAYNDEFDRISDLYDKERQLAIANGESLVQVEKDYNERITKLVEKRETQTEQLVREHTNRLLEIEQNRYDEARRENEEYYNEMLQDLRDFQSAISNLEGKTPIKNAWGFTDIKKTRKLNQETLDAYETMAKVIVSERTKLQRKFDNGLIDKDAYEATLREMDTFTADLGEKMDAVKAKMSFNAAFSALASEIDQWTQTIGRSLSQLLTSIWEYQDANYDHTMEELDKKIDEYDKLLQKQEDITREHADNINSIEDELSTARGDRRQHLIDQLNAEMQAQRESIAAEKRAQKEKKKAEDQQEQEELKQRKREHDRQVTQAFINWHLSISNALATQPFIPLGLAMGALATALGAVQYALVKNQKYADGGVLKGRSHAQGGIPVLGGRAEVEGNEFITNKRTTQQNTDLLYFINSKKRKLDLNDFIDFYGNGAVRKNIQSINRKYADGGVLPTLRTDIDVNSRLVTAMEDYSRRPVQVAVVDIIDKTQQVNNVKVMAGL